MAELKFSDLVEPVAVDQKTALRITVLGGGSFGTAMANLAVRNGCDTMIWIRDAAAAEEINQTHINKRYLPDYTLETGLRAVSDLKWLCEIAILFWSRFQVIHSEMCSSKSHHLSQLKRLFRLLKELKQKLLVS
jgi:glycerol-3-phosphate dehydrogenase